ncbi:MAG: hypothetical protein H8E53_00610, partial [Planctomycetes bacterium]|nr:hypothetical protein [Planctomycetota bacterium]
MMLKPEDVPGVQGYFRAAFGPEVIQAALPRGTVPIMVRGEYSRTVHKVGPAKPPAIFRALYVYIGMAVEGKGRFGKRILPVRVIDGNANWTLGDPWRPSGQDIRRGDTLAIDLGDGSFTKDVRKGCYGSPIEVDGAWYSVSLGETGKELTVAPLDVDLGKILVKHPEWSCMLIGKRNVFHLSGGVEPLVVPV